ncbi:hypothetical protein [Micromonospora chokoriensis]|uniref:Uncharacterized protein n=1 Tax=Micromonospora chokoriensis TaxID=356851 RepID=A0A1C4Z1F2_9ACTN|nr:hypothetical protein [Micromonospora chokoriensis]SCF26726.1 hypothetical protein GA0070612_5624 [Micromonospora chokoriensis]
MGDSAPAHRRSSTLLNADGQGGMAGADVTVEWQVSTTDRRLTARGTPTH